MPIKLEYIESLLNSPYEMDIDLWSVPLKTIHELENIYRVSSEYYAGGNNHWLTLNSGNVTLTLNTINKH